MQTRQIGQTGLRLTPITFGAAALGDMPDTFGYSVDEARARATINRILDGPANCLDTSRLYGAGRSEDRIGAAIAARGGLPAGFVLSTKLDRDLASGRFDAARARRSLEESLAALRVDNIDLLHLHDPEHARDLSEITGKHGAMAELLRMKEEGLATAIGIAMGNVALQRRLIDDWPVDAIINHNRFTLLNREADALFDACAAKGIAVLNAAPYASGVLAKGSAIAPRIAYQTATEEGLSQVRAIEAICARHAIPPGAAALQFSLRDPRITSTIVGVSRPERVDQTLAWATHPIPQAAWDALLALPFSTDDPEASRTYKPG
jgi:D-threo-aldose 1-dehydrogenase